MGINENLNDAASEYTLTVSKFAKLCGTTRDTLRYYYEQNILTPLEDENNGYHYYSTSQISSFFFITTMRQAGCSIREISELIHHSSRDSISKMVNSRILDMQRELYLINKKISALHLGMWILEGYEYQKPGTPFIDYLPEISVTSTPVTTTESYHTKDIAEDIALHLSKAQGQDALSLFPTGVTISSSNLKKGRYTYNSIISLSFLPSDNSESYPLPSSMAVICYHDHNCPDIERTYRKIVSIMKKNRLKACSDLYIISLINLYDKEANHKYFKYLFICVEPVKEEN